MTVTDFGGPVAYHATRETGASLHFTWRCYVDAQVVGEDTGSLSATPQGEKGCVRGWVLPCPVLPSV